MQRTTYRWAPERVTHRLFPFLVTGLWWGAWLSPPGQALHAWMIQVLPPWSLLPMGLILVAAGITWGTIAVFHAVDTTGKPAFIARLKLQRPFADPLRPTPAQAAWVILRNHGILFVGILIVAGLLALRGWDPTAGPAAWWVVLLQLIGMGLITEVLFFAGHRWLHTKWLYRRVHAVHHRFRAPTAWSAQYAHPFEYAIGNVLPIGLPMVLLAPDLLTIVLFGVLTLLNTQLVHSGYQLPIAPWSIPHDLHHYRVRVNYGSLGIMDRLFGSRMRRLPSGQDVELGAEAPVEGAGEAVDAAK